MTKKNGNAKTELGRTLIKKSTTHMIEQAVQWPTSVALNTHTLKGLGGVDIINRLSYREMQVVIKKIFIKAGYWTASVPEVGW